MADLTWLAELAESLVVQPALVLAALGPLDASVAAAHIERRLDLAAEVRALALVESRGQVVGVHREHARRVAGRRFWVAAARVGWLSPETCEAHLVGDGDRWGVRGAHGLAAAYSVRYLGACVAPEVLDQPLVSAVVAVRRLVVLERVYRLTTPAARAEAWRRGQTRPASARAGTGRARGARQR